MKTNGRYPIKLTISKATVPPSLANSAGFLFNRAARLIREAIEQALEPIGITPRELGILRTLGNEKPLTQQALGEKHDIDRTTVVQLIDELEHKQLVQRNIHPKDRRCYLISLTAKGQKIRAQAIEIADKTQTEFLFPLSEEQWHVLRDLITTVLTKRAVC